MCAISQASAYYSGLVFLRRRAAYLYLASFDFDTVRYDKTNNEQLMRGVMIYLYRPCLSGHIYNAACGGEIQIIPYRKTYIRYLLLDRVYADVEL